METATKTTPTDGSSQNAQFAKIALNKIKYNIVDLESFTLQMEIQYFKKHIKDVLFMLFFTTDEKYLKIRKVHSFLEVKNEIIKILHNGLQ